MKAVCVPFVLLLMFHLSQAQFTVQPVSVVQAEGVDAVFECLYPGAVSHSWGINGTFPADDEFPHIFNFTRTQPSGDTPAATLTIPATAHYNNTVVQCEVVVRGVGFRLTENATLTIFPITVNASNDTDTIILSWADLNFTTNLMYCVNFNKMTIVCNKTLPPVCGLTETQYTFKYPNHSLYDTFFFTVTPVDGGNQIKGTASEPVAGSFTSARGVTTVVSQGEDSDEKYVMFEAMVPECTLFTLYRVEFGSLVGSQNGTLNASGNVSITFSLPTDILTSISVTLTAANGIDLMFESSLSTSDIQRLLPETDCSESLSMCGRIEYAVDSFSPGALMYLVPTTSESSSIMLAVPRRGDNFSIGHIPPGRYSLLAFDLENNSLPRMPFSLASTSEIVEVRTSRGTAAPLPNGVGNITVKLLSGDVEVNCSIPVTNCLVLVHSINSPEQLFVQLINFTDDRTIVFSVDLIGNVTVAVLTWGENNSIFEGQLSFITQLEIYTVMSSTTTVTTTTTNTTTPIISIPGDGSLRTLPIPVVAGIVIATLVLVCISLVVLVLVVLVVIKKTKRGRKVLNSSYSHMNRTRHFNGYSNNEGVELTPDSVVDVCKDVNYDTAGSGIALSSTYDVIREENLHDKVDNGISPYDVLQTEDLSGIGSGPASLYDVARKENMYDSADATRSPYDVVSSDHLPPDYETVESVKAAMSPTSLLPPPLPPPMIRKSSEAPSLPAPYDSGVDTLLLDSVVNGSVENDVVKDESRQGYEKCADKTKDDTDDDEEEEKVIVEHLYVMVKAEPGANSDESVHPTRVVYAQVNKKKQKPVNLTGSAAAVAAPVRRSQLTRDTLRAELHLLAGRWEDLARALDMDEEKRDNIFSNSENDQLRLHELVELYFSSTQYRHTWEEMVQMLTDVEEHGIAGRIQEDKVNSQGTAEPIKHASVV
ncbi:uncharacterized protein LOC135340097 isoform X2 [Halichondria panicea]|uniref:uncharacterized protein LOC135340097 isoform X2 n=1 Tax=Halichondria panicea TaxID=6063 RepID=UPI00312B6741